MGMQAIRLVFLGPNIICHQVALVKGSLLYTIGSKVQKLHMKDQRGPKMTPLFYSALTFFYVESNDLSFDGDFKQRKGNTARDLPGTVPTPGR